MDPFGENVDLKEDFNISSNSNNSLSTITKKKLVILLIILIISTIVILVFLFIFLNNKSDNSNLEKNKTNNYDGAGELNCIYFINSINANISLLSKEFKNINNSIIDVYINDSKIGKYITEYKFDSIGNYNIKYILNSSAYLENAFKDIENIISIESIVYPNSHIKIFSLNSAFEGCSNLKNVSINNLFDASELKSMSKLFYNSGIKEINLTFDSKNVEDMSYMLSSTIIDNIDFLNQLNFVGLKNLSGFLKIILF